MLRQLFNLPFIHRSFGVRRVGDNEYIIRRWVGILHGCVRICSSVYFLLGVDTRLEALANGHHLPLVRSICGRSVRVRMRPTKHRCQNGRTSRYWWDKWQDLKQETDAIFHPLVCILFVNCYSVNLGMAVQNIFTSAKLVAVLIVIVGGAWKLFQGKPS